MNKLLVCMMLAMCVLLLSCTPKGNNNQELSNGDITSTSNIGENPPLTEGTITKNELPRGRDREVSVLTLTLVEQRYL